MHVPAGIACLVKQLFVGCHRLLIEVIALPIEGHTVTMASLNVSIQCVVCQVRLSPDKPLNLDWSVPDIEVVPE